MMPCTFSAQEMMMSEWRRVAMEFIPEMTRTITEVHNRTELWDELRAQFLRSVESRDATLCIGIVKYYRWCVSPARQRLPNDVQTSAVIGFLEKMVRTGPLIEILLKWLSKAEVLDYSWNVEYSAGMEAVEIIRNSKVQLSR